MALAFDGEAHTYTDRETGTVYPSVTQMLTAEGWIDDTWYTEESRVRGTAVHRLACEYDLGAIPEPERLAASPYYGWLMGYVLAMKVLLPRWSLVEMPLLHARHGFAGRPDRVGRVWGGDLVGVTEIKSGAKAKTVTLQNGLKTNAHAMQTALQAWLVSPAVRLFPAQIARLTVYVSADGGWQIESYDDPRELEEAQRIIYRYGRRA